MSKLTDLESTAVAAGSINLCSRSRRTRSKIKKKNAASVSFDMVLRSQVKKELKSIAITTLPEEILFNILVLLPAEILYAVMRYVCHQWRRIINDPGFVATHLLRLTSTLLVQFPKFHCQLLYVGECHIKLSDIKFQFPGRIVATCNGLTLVKDRRHETTHRGYFIANPVTNRIMTLPTLPLNVFRCILAFAPVSNTYKVLAVTLNETHKWGRRYTCAVLTVNVDRDWRLIDCADIGEFMSLFLCCPTRSGQFVYWVCDYIPCMLALDIESESIRTISLPQACPISGGMSYFLPKGNTLSYIHICRDFSIKVWVLKDHENQVWDKFPDLSVGVIEREATTLFAYKHIRFYHPANFLTPTSWLKNEEKILFRITSEPNSLFVYDVKTCGTFTFTMDTSESIFPHVSSLTWV